MNLPALLVVYHHPLEQNAPTIMDHTHSFRKYANMGVWEANIALGFPAILRDIQWAGVVLHYSLFGSGFGLLGDQWHRYVKAQPYKVVFFQDEHQYVPERLAFCRDLNIDRIYSLFLPKYFGPVYQEFAPRVKPTLAGYVSQTIMDKAYQFYRPVDKRRIDVGYRARRLSPWMGAGASEKHELGERFLLEAKGLQTDIMVCEEGRLYGDDWWRFLADCKFCLGAESGVSLTDLNNEARLEYERTGKISQSTLVKWDNKNPFRMISPRVFEAATFKVCQIMFPGYYNGLIQPWLHYIPLERDFSNLKEVKEAMRDVSLCNTIRDRIYTDLIQSKKYHYQGFVKGIDLPGGAPLLRIPVNLLSDVVRCGQMVQAKAARAARMRQKVMDVSAKVRRKLLAYSR